MKRAAPKSPPRDLFAAFLRVDAALVAAGFPATSPWWRETLRRFWTSGGSRQLVLRVGRRGGKSSTLCRVACTIALFGDHPIAPGDVGNVAIVSVSRDEAASRLRTIEAILRALDVPHARRGDVVELRDQPIVFKTFAATLSSVVGGTSIAVLCDEVARWRDAETGANPAGEVLGSLRPTLATTRGPMFLSSSPLSTLDAHAQAFDLGDTDAQIVAHAPTWIANPTILEAETRALEPDQRIWSREYAAVPQGAALGAFDADAVARAFRPLPEPAEGDEWGRPVLVIDASSGKSDTWAWGVASWMLRAPADHQVWASGVRQRDADGVPLINPEASTPRRPALVFHVVDGLAGGFWKGVSGEDVVARLAALARAWGTADVIGDQRESYMLSAAFKRHGLRFTEHTWTASSKPVAVERVRRWFADSTIYLPEHDALRRELGQFEERVTASGSFTFGARGTGHDDFVALLLTTALADAAGDLALSPQHVSTRRGERPISLNARF